MGSNGAGKSTLLNVITGELHPDEGILLIGGEDMTRVPRHKRAHKVVQLSQQTSAGVVGNMTVLQNMALAFAHGKPYSLRKLVDPPVARQVLEFLARLPLGLEQRPHTFAKDLSAGGRQGLALAMAVATEPQLLLLDEPTASLAPPAAAAIMQAASGLAESLGLATILVTHDIDVGLANGSCLLIMHQGQIVARLDQPAKSRLTRQDVIGLLADSWTSVADQSGPVIGLTDVAEPSQRGSAL
jgi:putative ABC transport system ATP-binding protein